MNEQQQQPPKTTPRPQTAEEAKAYPNRHARRAAAARARQAARTIKNLR